VAKLSPLYHSQGFCKSTQISSRFAGNILTKFQYIFTLYELFATKHVTISSNQQSSLIWGHFQVKLGWSDSQNWTRVHFHDWMPLLSHH